MKTYITIYDFEVIEKVKNGFTVHALDRERACVFCVNDMTVSDLAKLMISKTYNHTRYEFWIDTEEVEE